MKVGRITPVEPSRDQLYFTTAMKDIVPVEVVPVEDSQNTPKASQKTFIDSIRPLILLLQMTGQMPMSIEELKNNNGGQERSWRSYAKCDKLIVWFIVANLEILMFRVINWGPIFWSFGVAIAERGFSMLYFSALVTMTVVAVWSFCNWFVAMLTVSRFQKYLSKFSEDLDDEIEDKETWSMFLRKIHLSTRRGTMLMAFIVVCLVGGNMETIIGMLTVSGYGLTFMKEHMAWLYKSGCPQFFISCLGIAGQLQFMLDIVALVTPTLLFKSSCRALEMRFKHLTERFENSSTAQSLTAVRTEHHKLCKMTEATDAMYNSYVCIALILETTLAVSTVFLIIFGSKSEDSVGVMDIADLAWFASFLLLLLTAVALFRYFGAISVHEQAHSLSDPLNNVPLDNLTQTGRDQVLVMLHKVNGPQIGLTVGKIFVLTRSHLLTMLSIYATYIVLMIQFKQSEG